MAVHHVFLTRFNLPSQGTESLIRAHEGWLRSRAVLFERYTVPSVRHQTRASAAWLVYVDPESPTWMLERLSLLEDEGLLKCLRRTEVGVAELREDLAAVLVNADARDVLVTTNLDNDDGLSPRFVAALLAVEPAHERSAIYLTRGLITSPHGLYLRSDTRNAFCSVREPMADPLTCWATWHNLLHEVMPVEDVVVAPSWLQVIHGGNVSNRVRGRRVSPSAYRSVFGDLLGDLPEPTARELLADRLLYAPWRAVRDLVRTAGKQVLLRTTGKQGLDRVRYLIAARRSP